MRAAFGGHEAVVRLLLQNGAEVNATDQVMSRRQKTISKTSGFRI